MMAFDWIGDGRRSCRNLGLEVRELSRVSCLLSRTPKMSRYEKGKLDLAQ
jgi:hypothetical protein